MKKLLLLAVLIVTGCEMRATVSSQPMQAVEVHAQYLWYQQIGMNQSISLVQVRKDCFYWMQYTWGESVALQVIPTNCPQAEK